jgi:uroporphyrinogen-III synthase
MNLHGKRIVVTRAAHQADELADLLREHGAVPLLYPCIAIEPPPDISQLDTALHQLSAGQFDLLILTSANTVEALRQRVQALGLSLNGIHAAAVGPATEHAARQFLGVTVNALPDEYIAESLALAIHPTPEMRILLPQADIAPDTLRDLLTAMGTDVTAITSYHTVLGKGGVDLPGLLVTGQVDAITFPSSSTVTHCIQRVTNEGGRLDILVHVPAVCIGPKTARTASDAGFTHGYSPDHYTLAGIIDSLLNI